MLHPWDAGGTLRLHVVLRMRSCGNLSTDPRKKNESDHSVNNLGVLLQAMGWTGEAEVCLREGLATRTLGPP